MDWERGAMSRKFMSIVYSYCACVIGVCVFLCVCMCVCVCDGCVSSVSLYFLGCSRGCLFSR